MDSYFVKYYFIIVVKVALRVNWVYNCFHNFLLKKGVFL